MISKEVHLLKYSNNISPRSDLVIQPSTSAPRRANLPEPLRSVSFALELHPRTLASISKSTTLVSSLLASPSPPSPLQMKSNYTPIYPQPLRPSHHLPLPSPLPLPILLHNTTQPRMNAPLILIVLVPGTERTERHRWVLEIPIRSARKARAVKHVDVSDSYSFGRCW